MTTTVQQAVILAAGQGSRLRSEVADRPKGFLALGAKPIVEESVERLVAAGIRDVVIVTGYAAGHYEALAARLGGVVRTVHNATFAESGSMYSLWCARRLVTGDFLLLESDLIYEQRALTTLLEPGASDTILVSGPTGAGDEVYVEAPAGQLLRMSKRRADLGPEVLGEFVGISRLSAPLFAHMQALAESAFARSLRYDYETDCLVAAAAAWPVRCRLIPDLLWGEIDDPAHLARARERVYPAIAAR